MRLLIVTRSYLRLLLPYAVLIFSTFSCDKEKTKPEKNGHEVTLRYAKGFSVRTEGNLKWVEIKTPYQGATNGLTYLLIPREESLPEISDNVKVIRTPVRSIVCTSTSHLPLLDYIGESDKLVGFPQTDYISSENIRARVDQGKVTDVGVESSMNLETLVSLRPELVMGYAVSSDYGQFKKIEELRVPVVLNSEYLERHPLGRAEWIKFMALFFDKEKEADSVFTAIEERYLSTKLLVDTVSMRPSALNGILYGDAWFMPGGQNYAARLMRDAGCRYLWEDDPSSGFLELDFESVYEKAREADIWLGVGSHASLEELARADRRYKLFTAFQKGHVYTYDARKGARGGSEYMELGYLRPDIILQDLVKIAHPALLPDYQLYFHRRLE